MISSSEIGKSIAAVLAMAQGKEDWAGKLDLSVDGVFRSFWAMVLSLPLMVLVAETGRRLSLAAGSEDDRLAYPVWLFTLQETLVRLMVWPAMLAILVTIAARSGAGWRVTPLIIAQNYASLLTYIVMGLALGLIVMADAVAYANIAIIVVAAFSIWLDWGILRRPLQLDVTSAALLLILLWVSGDIIAAVLSSLLGVPLRALAGIGA